MHTFHSNKIKFSVLGSLTFITLLFYNNTEKGRNKQVCARMQQGATMDLCNNFQLRNDFFVCAKRVDFLHTFSTYVHNVLLE